MLRVNLSRSQVESAPGIESDRPVSRQYEMAHAAHYGYPYYWSGPMLWAAAACPLPPVPGERTASPSQENAERAAQAAIAQGDSHLRSGAEVIGYGIEARDGAIGDVEDFVLDQDTWAISHVVVDTRKWWPGGHVRISPESVERIDRNERKLHVRLMREELRAAGQ